MFGWAVVRAHTETLLLFHLSSPGAAVVEGGRQLHRLTRSLAAALEEPKASR